MAEYDNNMTGVLFKNDKNGNDKAPDYKGFCEVNGEKLSMAAWIREKKDGSGKFMSIRFEEPRENNSSRQDKKPSEDVPF